MRVGLPSDVDGVSVKLKGWRNDPKQLELFEANTVCPALVPPELNPEVSLACPLGCSLVRWQYILTTSRNAEPLDIAGKGSHYNWRNFDLWLPQLGLPRKCRIYGVRNTVPVTVAASLCPLRYRNRLTGSWHQSETIFIWWYQILVGLVLKYNFHEHIHRS